MENQKFDWSKYEESKKIEDERINKFLLSVQQSQLESQKAISSLNDTIEKLQSSIQSAKNTTDQIDQFKQKFSQALNSLAEKIGDSLGAGLQQNIFDIPQNYDGPIAKESSIEEVSKLLSSSKNIIFLTGAGLSAASGVPTFRGKGGFWTSGNDTYEAQKVLTYRFLEENRELCWAWHRDFQNTVKGKQKNINHIAIADLHLFINKNNQDGQKFSLVTQNIDGFHASTYPQEFSAFGFNKFVYEIHGNINYYRCDKFCMDKQGEKGVLYQMPDLNVIPIPKCPNCDGNAHPHILFFDESYDEPHYHRDSVRDLMMECDCLVVIGTKLETGMSNSIVREAMKKNINIIEINPEPIIKIGKTFTINGNAEDSVPQICKRTIQELQNNKQKQSVKIPKNDKQNGKHDSKQQNQIVQNKNQSKQQRSSSKLPIEKHKRNISQNQKK